MMPQNPYTGPMPDPRAWTAAPCAPEALFDVLADEPGAFFLDSSLPDPKHGRWSFVLNGFIPS